VQGSFSRLQIIYLVKNSVFHGENMGLRICIEGEDYIPLTTYVVTISRGGGEAYYIYIPKYVADAYKIRKGEVVSLLIIRGAPRERGEGSNQ